MLLAVMKLSSPVLHWRETQEAPHDSCGEAGTLLGRRAKALQVPQQPAQRKAQDHGLNLRSSVTEVTS